MVELFMFDLGTGRDLSLRLLAAKKIKTFLQSCCYKKKLYICLSKPSKR